VTRGRISLVCAVAPLTMVAGWFVVNAGYEAISNCNPDPYVPPRCEAPGIAYLSIQFGPWLVLFGPLLVATYLLARREAIVLSVVALTWALEDRLASNNEGSPAALISPRYNLSPWRVVELESLRARSNSLAVMQRELAAGNRCAEREGSAVQSPVWSS
jgi:hypothetical protein